MAKSDVLVRMKADTQNYDANIAKAKRTLDNFKQENLSLGGVMNQMVKSFTAYAAGIASISVIGGKLAEVTSEAVELAKQGEGVRLAFERLNQPGLLDNLREATHGTVTNLELMKAAVQFNDFNLPIKELGTMLAFAQQKAKDTGQSIDYLVNSIVTGLGRKSKMILDNLGISATEIDEKMKKTGDMTKAVGEIIREQMSKAGDYVETAADRAAQADVKLKNSMEELGRTLMPLTDAGQGLFNTWKVAAIDLLNSAIKPLIQAFTQLGAIQKIQDNVNGGGFLGRITENLRNAKNKEGVYSQQLMEINKAVNKARSNLQQAEKGGMGSIEIYRNRLKALEGIRDQYIKVAAQIMSPEPDATQTTPGKTTGDKNKKDTVTYAADSIAAQEALVSELNKKWREAGEAVRGDYLTQLIEAERKLKNMKDEQAALRDYANGKLKGGKVQTSGIGSFTGDYQEIPLAGGLREDALEALQKLSDITTIINKKVEEQAEAVQKTREAWNQTGQAIGMVGNMMSSIKDPAAQTAGAVAQAIANIAMAYSQALAEDGTIKSNIWYFIAASAAAMVSMATTISQIHSATGYAEGGIVKGDSYSGDNLYGPGFGINAGELVLSVAQQNALANTLTRQSEGGGMMQARVSGENIYLALNNYLKRTGQGELLTWG